MKMTPPVIMWFRRDLRLADNTALDAAVQSGQPVVSVFIADPNITLSPRAGGARLHFLLNALESLEESLRQVGGYLRLEAGEPISVLPRLITEVQATALYFNTDYSPYARQRDSRLIRELPVPVYTYDDAALKPPTSVLKADGRPYTVYTPYRNNWNTQPKAETRITPLNPRHFYQGTGRLSEITSPRDLPPFADHPPGNYDRLPSATQLAAQQYLDQFTRGDLLRYDVLKNNMPEDPWASTRPGGTSYLSPYLRLGLLSPRQAYHAARTAYTHTTDKAHRQSIETWVSELTWRDFYMQILYHFPHVLQKDFVSTYESLEWREDAHALRAWQEGMTGYPVVDAPMRQLKVIGWMPNRARMIVASFLTKHLLIHWKHGDIHFMQHLIDGDPASNNGGWQWAAGTGTDAQPYFRIFNPVAQSEKFASSTYLRHWLPELKDVPDRFVHTPWLAPQKPKGYPDPIIEHTFARHRTLDAFKKARAAYEARQKGENI
jgi:deoxyribodipyrimidine photo-lyase